MIKNSYILNIDVLGFGSLVKTKTVQEVFNYYSKIITRATLASSIIDKENLDVMVYSDTIAIRSRNTDNGKCLYDLVRIANMIQIGQYYSALYIKSLFLPMRGTIAHGDFIFYKGDIWTQAPARSRIEAKNVDIIIGKPIVESYELEKKMELMCVALADSVLKSTTPSCLEILEDQNLILKYDIPMKNGGTKEMKIVNPVSFSHVQSNLKKLQFECKKHEDDTSVKNKYLNTIELFKYVKKNNLYYPKIPE